MDSEKERLEKLIDQFNKSSVKRDYDNLRKRKSMMEICGVRTNETSHSAFLKWLFCNEELLRISRSPIFLLILLYAKTLLNQKGNKSVPDSAVKLVKDVLTEKITPKEVEGSTEVTTDDRKRMDIVLRVKFDKSEKDLLICIENKINHSETDQQCGNYYEYCEKYYKDCERIYIFLSRDEDNGPKERHFVHVLYQNIYEEILQPLLKLEAENLPIGCHRYLQEYTDTLTSISNTLPPIVMSDQYKSILNEIRDKYFELFNSAITEFGTEEEKKVIDIATSQIYIIYLNNVYETICKNRTKLAFNVVKLLATKAKKTSIELIKELGTIEDKKVIVTKDNKRSYCLDKAIRTPDGFNIYISKQWSYDSVNSFIRLVQEKFPEITIKRHLERLI